jgi:hypothetical protein
MNQKLVISVIIIVITIISFSVLLSLKNEVTTSTSDIPKLLTNITPINISQQGTGKITYTTGNSIFETFVYSGDAQKVNEDGSIDYKYGHFLLKPENTELYNEIGIANQLHNSVIVVPFFTMTAYGEPGFYNYFRNECDTSCLTDIPIRYEMMPTFQSSGNAIKVLRLLGYPYITDIEIDKNPEILNLFDKVILLHSEYVTKRQFDAITNHPKVMYLYPNSLYAEIDVDYENDTISLVKGHSYPSPEIKNGFEWEFDNTPQERNLDCNNWEFVEIKNGVMLNCYPENIIFQNKDLLKAIKEY